MPSSSPHIKPNLLRFPGPKRPKNPRAPEPPPTLQGYPTLLSLARSHSDPTPPDIPSLLSLLDHISSLPVPTVPEHLFPPFFRAFAKSGAPSLALRLFQSLLPVYRCAPTAKSLNSALSVLAACRPHIAGDFVEKAVAEHRGICPNGLTFNLLVKAAVRRGAADEGVELMREMKRRGLTPDAYTYSTLIDGMCRANRVEDAMGLLDEMQA